MRKYFDHAYEGFCNSFMPITNLVNCMAEVCKIVFVYATLPIWIIPYMTYRKIEERKDNND